MPKTKATSKKRSAPRAAAKAKGTSVTSKAAKLSRPATTNSLNSPRKLQPPKRYWHKPLTWQHRPAVPQYKPLPKARLILWNLLKQLWKAKAVYSGVVAIYGILMLLLVRGLASASDVATIKDAVTMTGHGFGNQISSGFTSFVYLLSAPGTTNSVNSGVYQTILIIICSLAFIWCHRQISAGHSIRIRDGFYAGMAPLVPFLLLFLLIGVQLIPLALGSWLYASVITNGIAIHWWEQLAFGLLFAGVALWSLRMITASIFALYIVTLPEMTPLRAYRSARQLVYGRRLLVWRKLIFLPVVLFLLIGAIEIPLILFIPPIAVGVFFVGTLLLLPIINGYLYNLYREML